MTDHVITRMKVQNSKWAMSQIFLKFCIQPWLGKLQLKIEKNNAFITFII